ncbi:hypothetical protein [Bacillus sp. NP247]|uniref:hypothetical protein n=1 Tax=Bacillus sp. NP247 TaxID=2846779 RepID=UPI001C629BF8|nr:hypothetical protein [Bacillus sp. NP247]QWU46381.1 hypothetical protein KPL75_05440 [Bacillus sp. NP247]
MKVNFKDEVGKVIFSEENNDVPGLIAILKETRGVTVGIVKYEVTDYEFRYFMICPDNDRKMVSELDIILREIR